MSTRNTLNTRNTEASSLEHAKDRRRTLGVVVLFAFTYMVSYITRINYGAVISEIERAEQISKSLLSLPVTGAFITYGTGQILSGICGDKFSPKKLISLGLLVTSLMNLLLPLCTSPGQMLAVWCVNGLAQSFMWPPLVRLMSALLSEDDYKNAIVKVSWGSSAGTILIYLVSPLLITLFGWRAVFLFSAFCGVVMLLIWNKSACDVKSGGKEEKAARADAKDRAASRESRQEGRRSFVLFTPVFLCIMTAIVLMGMLRDGVTTWMPSYISDVYHLSSSISILVNVVLPIFSILCYQAAMELYKKVFSNPLLCAGAFFSFSTLCALLLFTLSGRNAVLSVLSSALLTGCMHGINLILVCMIPSFYKKYGNVSKVSGILNSCTYVGSAISTYGIALLSESYSWRFTLFVWLVIVAAGALLCFLSARPWKKYMPEVH